MPLLCTISLLFLPLALSCVTQKTLEDIGHEFQAFIEDHIRELMRNISAPCREREGKSPNCSDTTLNQIAPIHRLTCRMQRLGLRETEKLQELVLNSLNCRCHKRRRRNTTTSAPTGIRRERRSQLCKVKLLLKDIETCYQMLNSSTTTTTSRES